MPELPEVETVRRGLSPQIIGATLDKLYLHRADLRYPFPQNMRAQLEGARLHNIDRRSKYLLFQFDNEYTLLAHLGMSGSFRFLDMEESLQKHDHVEIWFDNGARLIYHDPRRFGAMDVTQAPEAHKWLAHLGAEPLGNHFDADYLAAQLANKSTNMKTLLLDQRLIAGLGNIYVNEALWYAKIHPERQGKTLGRAEIERLVVAIRDVLQAALASGGLTLRDYRQADGTLGYFQHRFQVYEHEGEDCRKDDCGGKIERSVQSGRSTYFCPCCQV